MDRWVPHVLSEEAQKDVMTRLLLCFHDAKEKFFEQNNEEKDHLQEKGLICV